MKPRPLTGEQIEDIKKSYSTMLAKDLAQQYQCTVGVVYRTAHNLGLKKDIEFIRETTRKKISDPNHGGRKTLFKTNHLPYNKGKQQSEYMDEEAILRSSKTRFKKGNIPSNHKPLGYERITKDGYIEVKCSEPNTFKLKHRVVWEQHNGPIPKGYNIQFKDKDKQNISIDNLYMISRTDQLKNENSIYCYPIELVNVIRLKGAFKRQINKKKKK